MTKATSDNQGDLTEDQAPPAEKKKQTKKKAPAKTTALTGAAENKAPARGVSTVSQLINSPSFLEQIGDCIPQGSGVTNTRFKRLLWTSVQKTPKLLQCSIQSMASCAFDMAQLDLTPGAHYGEAHLIPFKTTCTLILGYKGLMKLVIRSGAVEHFEVAIVYKCDKFKAVRGLVPDLIHEPDYNHKDRLPDKIIGAYSIAELPNGKKRFEYMTRKELDKIGNAAKAKANGRSTPWTTDYEEMLKKTVLRRHCKLFPMPEEVAGAINQDAENERTGHKPESDDTITVNAEEVPPTSIQELTEESETATEAPVEDGKCKMCKEGDAGPAGNCMTCQAKIDAQ